MTAALIAAEISNLSIALVGGVVPVLIWLIYWLAEDRAHPEPKRVVARVFLAGMAGVTIALWSQIAIEYFLRVNNTILITLWATVEEIAKYAAAYFVALRTDVADEPIDFVVYMITAALGFAALENTLFILGPVTEGIAVDAIITGNLRFIGATVLHTLTAGVLGVFLAYSFYRYRRIRFHMAGIGLILAILLHSVFNFFILQGTSSTLFLAFGIVWIAVIVLLVIIDHVKRLKRRRIHNTN